MTLSRQRLDTLRLPFAVDAAVLRSGVGEQWAVRCRVLLSMASACAEG